MWWILFIVCQAAVIISGIRNEKRAGLWSGSKFVFSLGFAALELVILWAPLYFLDANSRWFVSAMTAVGILAALNFIWFIIVSRRWKLPDGRTSLQAYRDEHPDK
jgi:uncharacterized membrane protein YqjE